MTLLLIRHGETDFNAGRIVQFPDTPLGSNGLVQAESLGRHMAGRAVSLVLSSDYQRALSTAERVAAHTGAPLRTSALLRERNFGDLRGRPYADFGPLDIFAADYQPPNGESWSDFNARVDAAWREVLAISADIDGEVAVVTHGLVLRSLCERVLDLGQHGVPGEITVANTAVTIVERMPPWRVRDFACVAHLADGARDVAPV